jgi:uncharacterized protein
MVTIIKRLCIGLVALTLAFLAQAQDQPTGHHFAAVDPEIRQKAEAGDREAQNEMGSAAQDDRNYPEAAKWFTRSAEQGFSGAQVSLGFFYGLGLGVEKDLGKSAHWYSLAATQGDPDGEFNMGICYLHGYGVPQNFDEANLWFMRALNHGPGEGRSANGIGLSYETRPTKNKNKDYADAFRWYLKGAEMDYTESKYNVCRLSAQGLGGLTIDYQEAIKWCTEVADSGDEFSTWGQYGMGRINEDGSGVPKDLKLAADWYRKAAEQGHVISQMKLVEFYSAGKGVERDLVQAYMWAKIAGALDAPQSPGLLEKLAKQMEEAQISQAQELAEKWMKDHPIDPERAADVIIDGKHYMVSRPQ